jgi:Squalene-hopene cyclase C-terminal domain
MLAAVVVLGFVIPLPLPKPTPAQVVIEAAIPKLVAGATGHADQKTCFACHNQAYPLLALTAARDRGLAVPEKFFKAQAKHITGFLAENKDRFLDGRGTGGGATTAAFSLLALELVGHKPDDNTAAVSEYLLKFEPNRDHWRTNSNRPPTEFSDFTTTYVAMRALRTYGVAADKEKIAKRVDAAHAWLIKASAKETEDRVFRLLGLKEAGADEKSIAAAAWDLLKTQRADGGWSQLDDGTSDAYATGSALFALHHDGGLKPDSPAYAAGVAFLVKTQLSDGTWKVKSRSKPFQPYYESGFPHEKDQFISIAATGWATAALAVCVPAR